jgi:hypothetical protein
MKLEDVWSWVICTTLTLIGLGMAALFFSQAYKTLTCS